MINLLINNWPGFPYLTSYPVYCKHTLIVAKLYSHVLELHTNFEINRKPRQKCDCREGVFDSDIMLSRNAWSKTTLIENTWTWTHVYFPDSSSLDITVIFQCMLEIDILNLMLTRTVANAIAIPIVYCEKTKFPHSLPSFAIYSLTTTIPGTKWAAQSNFDCFIFGNVSNDLKCWLWQ